jgi:hypothetical protein
MTSDTPHHDNVLRLDGKATKKVLRLDLARVVVVMPGIARAGRAHAISFLARVHSRSARERIDQSNGTLL